MVQVICKEAHLEGKKIVCADSPLVLSGEIEKGNVLVLKNVFRPDFCEQIRKKVFDWGLRTAPSNPKVASQCYHRIDNNPPSSDTPHVFHSYYFHYDAEQKLRIEADYSEMPELLTAIVVLQDYQNKLAGSDWQLTPDSTGRQLRPQIIQYPSGGGFFGLHEHPLLPQKAGFILSLSEKGKDFFEGGTRFKVDGHFLEVEKHLQIGDVAIFRYDVPHDVSVVDAKEKLNFNSEKGRWTLVLPFN